MNWSQLIINILVIGGLGSIVLYYVVKFFLGESEYKKSALITFTVAIVGYLIQSLQYQIMGMVAFFVVVLVSFFMLKQIYKISSIETLKIESIWFLALILIAFPLMFLLGYFSDTIRNYLL